jgi:HAD superfamily hydrolase (TIGR01490 family)
MNQPFAVFDIDGTLIRWQLYHSIVSRLATKGLLSADADKTIRTARMAWKTRAQDDSFKQYEHAVVQAYNLAITNLAVSEYLAVVDEVFAEYKDQTYRYTRDLIAQLKQQNYLLFAISGSQQEIVDKLAAHYGFDTAVGAVYEQQNGSFTGHVETPALGKEKHLTRLLETYHPTHTGSIAVGDSESDIALLRAVEQPVAFNPNAGLYATAKASGWKIVVERKNVTYELQEHHGNYLLA